MGRPATILAVLLVVGLLLGAGRPGASGPAMPEATDRGGLTFGASVDPSSRRVIDAAIALARPEARPLLDRIDGFTTVHIGRPPGGALGTARSDGSGYYDVVLDLGQTMRATGVRGANRLVLHELGHVVDFELVDDALGEQLDAIIPPGAPCPAGSSVASCAPREERFAETFAKWAMGNDIGADLYIGYAVPPPSSFERWAAPLLALAPPGA